jgi:hypothetical protein
VGAQLSQARWIEAKVMAGAAAFFFHQAGGLQHLKMLRYGGAADREPISQFADCGRALSQQVENGLAGWIRESGQQLRSVSHTLV